MPKCLLHLVILSMRDNISVFSAIAKPCSAKSLLLLTSVLLTHFCVTSWLQAGCPGSHLGSKLEILGSILAPSWGVLRSSWLQVGGSWGHFGSKLGGLGSKLGGFGSILAPSWVSSRLPHAVLLTYQKPCKNHRFFNTFGGFGRASWLQVGGSLGHFGSKIEDLGATWPLETASWSNLAT